MNILWILEDALRPDHMGCYGYSRNTTPVCDRLASEGVRFDSVVATASHTLPPIISMLTGQNAATHGVVTPGRYARWIRDKKRPQKKPTLLNLLADRGYRIDGELVMRWAPLGFERDTPSNEIENYFETHRQEKWFFFAEPYPTHLPYNPPERYFRMFYDGERKPDKAASKRIEVVRSFLIVHPSGCISKLEAGEEEVIPDSDGDEAHKRTAGQVDLLPEDREAVLALYDGEARVFDDLVGCWIKKLEDLGILDDTLIIVTADHGEELMERGHVGHSSCNLKGTLYDESILVPLIMRLPGTIPAGKIVPNQISQIDIMPTILDLLDMEIPEWMEGRSTLPLIRSESEDFREEACSETTPAGWQALADDKRQIWSVRTSGWKLIKYSDPSLNIERFELFDLQDDPGERRNLVEEKPDVVRTLSGKLEEYIALGRQHGLS